MREAEIDIHEMVELASNKVSKVKHNLRFCASTRNILTESELVEQLLEEAESDLVKAPRRA